MALFFTGPAGDSMKINKKTPMLEKVPDNC